MHSKQSFTYPVLGALFIAMSSAVPAHAYLIQNNEYHPSLCQLIPLQSANYKSELTVPGFVISALTAPAATATFICPVTLTTNIATFYLTNLSYSMDATSLSSPAVQPTCSLVLDNSSPTGPINVLNITGSAGGPDTNNYGGVNRAYLSCWITPSQIRFNRYTASMSYFQ